MLALAGDWPLSSIRVASHFLVFAGDLFVSSQHQERRGRCSLQVICGGPLWRPEGLLYKRGM